MRRLLLSTVLAFAAIGFAPALPSAHACPMCKLANEKGSSTGCEQQAIQHARPKAYMYSILFMLSMPATLLGGFSLGFYRLHRKQQALLAQQANSEGADPQA